MKLEIYREAGLFVFRFAPVLNGRGKKVSIYFIGTLYQLKIHGFAWYLPREVKEEGEDYLILVLKDTAITRESYPFSFEIKLRCFLIPRQQEAKKK